MQPEPHELQACECGSGVQCGEQILKGGAYTDRRSDCQESRASVSIPIIDYSEALQVLQYVQLVYDVLRPFRPIR